MQYPALAGPVFDALTVEGFTHPEYAAVRAAIDTAGGTSAGLSGAQWLDMVRQQTTSTVTSALISELGVEAIQVDDDKLPRYIAGVLARLQEVWLGRQIAEVKSNCSACRRSSKATNTTRCSATWSPWRPIGAAC